MLIDRLMEQDITLEYLPGYSVNDTLAPIKARARDAIVYVFDESAVTMAASVSLSKPSSLLSALPWARLPFDKIWIEFANEHLRSAMRELGSPNIAAPGSIGHLNRSGFLLTAHPTGIEIEYVHEIELPNTGAVVDLCSMKAFLDLSEFKDVVPVSTVRTVHEAARGRVRHQMALIANDPSEQAAAMAVNDHLDWDAHPDLEPVAGAVNEKQGLKKVMQLHEGWFDEMHRMVTMFLLPAIILLNTRNAVSAEAGPSLEKINKKRLKAGKLPLFEHKIVRLHLSARQHHTANHDGTGGRATRSHLVAGHFKVRKTGVFWWSPHARGSQGLVTRAHIVSR